MLEYTLTKIIFLVLIYRIDSLDYPCQESDCGNHESCFPVALNCHNGNCSYQKRCLKSRSSNPCPRGDILMRDNESPYTCNKITRCPSETFCHGSNTERNNLCCWKPEQRSQQEFLACPIPSSYGDCSETCQEDSNCRQNERCCYNGCGKSCIAISATVPDNLIHRPGSCPTNKPRVFICSLRRRCYIDADCKGGYKCCHISGCGSICRPPITGNNRRTFTNIISKERPPKINRQRSFQNTVQQKNQFNEVSQQRISNNYPEELSQNSGNQFNPPADNYNTNDPNSQIVFKCPWFRVLYGGC